MDQSLQKQAAEVLGLLETLDTTDVSSRTARTTMATIPKALEELKTALWPHEVRVETPVPDKVSFHMVVRGTQFDLLFHFRADGIYFDGERLSSLALTVTEIQQLVIAKLKANVTNIVDTATA